MGKISKDYDVEGKSPPSADSGTNFFDNPQIEPFEKPIPEGKDMKESNSTEPESHNKGIPKGLKQGSGY
jgi:hypothetical protein